MKTIPSFAFRHLAFFWLLSLFGLTLCATEAFASTTMPHTESIQSYLSGGPNNDYAPEIIVLDQEHLLIAGNTTSPHFNDVQEVTTVGKRGKSDIYIALVSLAEAKISKLLFIGGSDNDFLNAMTQGPTGEIYLTGNTFSHDFPAQEEFGHPVANKKTDAFLLKINAKLTEPVRSIRFGGDGFDYPAAITSSQSHVYIGGNTASINFPVTPGSFNTTFNKTTPGKNSYGFDAFIIAFDLELTTQNAATFIGGEADEFIRDMEYKENTNLVVSGFTLSSDFYRTKGINATPSTSFGLSAFITIVTPDLDNVTESLLFGTTNHLYVRDMAIDPDGSFWLTGYCTDGNFPTTANVIANRYKGGGYDSFIAHVSEDMNSIEAATYLGGSNNEFAQKILISKQGNVIVGGFTDSFKDFPITLNNNSTLNAGHFDTFTTELSRDLSTVHYSLLTGGSGYDYLYGMAVRDDAIFISGNSTSTNTDSIRLNDLPRKGKYNSIYIQKMPLIKRDN